MLHLTTNAQGLPHFLVTAEDEKTVLAMFAPAADQQGAIEVLRLAVAEIEKALAAGTALRDHGATGNTPDEG